MAQPNKFEFNLNIGGIDEEVISQAPKNWLNTSIKYTRSKVYAGLFRGETSPTVFVTKAAYLLRKALYTSGINAFVKSTVNLLDPQTWLYNTIFKGILDFSTAIDSITSFTINAISADFSVQLAANDSTTYAIPLDVPEAIQLELTALSLNESASIFINPPTDGVIHSDYFPEIQVINNQQNSVNASAFNVNYTQIRNPDFSLVNTKFYQATTPTNILIKGSLTLLLFNTLLGGASKHLNLSLFDTGGTNLLTIYDGVVANGTAATVTVNVNASLPLGKGQQLMLFMQNFDSVSADVGITVQTGQLNLSYQTISPPTMCNALPAFYVFQYLLQAMNTNQNSGPNLPVPFKSDLLNGVMSDLVMTSSDSIKTALGSLYRATDTLFPGTYKVVSGSILYGGNWFNTNDTFPYNPLVLSFTGTGIVEKVVSGFIGVTYNQGEILQAGGKYLVGGTVGTYATYNAINYYVGDSFDWKLSFDTFTGSDDKVFVQQTGVKPQLLINFKDAYQSIYSVQGGNCSFGIENGTCFIENLDYVYRGSLGNLDAGIVDKGIKLQPAADMIGNTLIVGYKDRQYTQLNGFVEVNSQQNYGTSLIVPKKEINLVSVFRADPYGIEEIRVSQNDTASSRSDNDTFMVFKKTLPENTLPFTYYHPLRTETLASITGVDVTYYNWFLSPKQNLLRGGNYLASMYWGMKGYKIILTGATKNTAMVTIDNLGRRIAEYDPIFISTLPKPLFIPIYATFKPGLPTNALQMIDSLPYGFIKFTYNNKVFKMFADTISMDIGQNTEQELKGLLTPDNDLQQLIH